jgi:hypothetical protein
MTTSTGNAWGNKGNQGKPAGPGQAVTASTPAEHHVPVRDFNANEVKDYLKKSKCYIATKPRAQSWKPHTKSLRYRYHR